MSHLILMRHGKAEIAGLSGGDAERPLAERGRTESVLAAAWLAAAGFSPGLVLVSAAVRTRETWESARDTFPAAAAEPQRGLYLATSETMLEAVLAAEAGFETLMIVGHNPGLQELGLRLAIEADAPRDQIDRISRGFPTAAAWVFRIEAGRGVSLEAAYEPPRAPGEPPLWAFLASAPGDRS
jgi:phosphohistidine phosphatase